MDSNVDDLNEWLVLIEEELKVLSDQEDQDDQNRESKESNGENKNDEEDEEGYEKTTAEKAQLAKIVSGFTPDQLDRYEAYRRSAFPKPKVAKLARDVGCPISELIAMMFGALGKMFVGDIVETARLLMTQRNCQGPIRPEYLRKAYQRLGLEGKLLHRIKRRRL